MIKFWSKKIGLKKTNKFWCKKNNVKKYPHYDKR